VLQVQPYIQLMGSWNLNQMLQAIKARMTPKKALLDRRNKPSDMEKFRKRKQKCES